MSDIRGGAQARASVPSHLAERILASRSALEGERKTVTALVCDIVDSTGTAERVGPEAMAGLVEESFTRSLAEVHRYEGTVTHSGATASWRCSGRPWRYEDHAQRAVLAASAIAARPVTSRSGSPGRRAPRGADGPEQRRGRRRPDRGLAANGLHGDRRHDQPRRPPAGRRPTGHRRPQRIDVPAAGPWIETSPPARRGQGANGAGSGSPARRVRGPGRPGAEDPGPRARRPEQELEEFGTSLTLVSGAGRAPWCWSPARPGGKSRLIAEVRDPPWVRARPVAGGSHALVRPRDRLLALPRGGSGPLRDPGG